MRNVYHYEGVFFAGHLFNNTFSYVAFTKKLYSNCIINWEKFEVFITK